MHGLAILSDIHGNIPALESVVEDVKKRRVPRIINLGDHVSGPLWPKATIQYLMAQNATAQARRNGCLEWEIALRTGVMHGGKTGDLNERNAVLRSPKE